MITIYPADIPEEGLHLSGSIEEDIFQLAPEDEVKPAGPAEDDLHLILSDDLLLAQGRLEAPFRLNCVVCLESFLYTCRLGEYLADFDLDGDKPVELTELFREDLLLALPAYPHCDQGDDADRACPKADRLKPPETESDSAEKPSAWDVLDGLGTPGESGD